jgi:hypothetical protein
LMLTKESKMNFDKDVLISKWKDISTIALKKWDEISEKDLEKVKGNAVAMANLFQEKLGVSREEATRKVEELLSKYDAGDLKAKVEKTAGLARDTASTILGVVKEKMKK